MSMGIGGFCRKVFENDNEVIYEYSSYNLNEARYINENRIADGFIAISKSVLDSERIREAVWDFPVRNLADAGEISIKNCTNTWKTENGYDIIALRLCRKLICEYQLKGKYPETVGWNI